MNDSITVITVSERQHVFGKKITDGGLTRKFWVLPSGEVCSFGCEFHFSFLLNHPELMAKYGIDPGDRTEQPIRINAVKRGLFRMNFKKKEMHLTIEGVQSLLTDNIRSGIQKVVRELDSGINRITVHLFDPQMTDLLTDETRDTSLLAKKDLQQFPTGGCIERLL
jgi:hypothetical protein